MITQKIQQIFHDRETEMVAEIWDTIVEDKFKVYKVMREEYSEAFIEIHMDRKKIDKKKKSKKEKARAFKNNTRSLLYTICKALNNTVVHYKALYYENDYYRLKKLMDVREESKDLTDKKRDKALQD